MAKEDVKLLISADGQKAIKEISEVTQHMGKMGGAVTDFLGTATGFLNWQTAAAAGLGAVAAGFGKLLVDAMSTADEMANMSKRTGIAVESLSRLSYVAKMSDTDMGTLQKSMKFLNTALYDVSKGNQAAIEKFKEFGIEVFNADGSVKNAEQALIATADAYAKLESDAAKTALATQIFGKAGQELMPMLEEGGAGIKALADEAQRMGVVVSTETAQAAEEFNDKLDKMKTFANGVANQVLVELNPALRELTKIMDDFNSSGNATTNTADGIGIAFRILGTSLVIATRPIRGIFGMLSQGAQGVKALLAGDFGEAAKYFALAVAPDEQFVDSFNMTKGLWTFGGDTVKQGAGQKLVYDPLTGMRAVQPWKTFQPFMGTGTKGNGGGGGGNGGKGSGSKNTEDAEFQKWLLGYDNYAAGRVMTMNPSLMIQGPLEGNPLWDDPDIMGLTPLFDNALPAQLDFIDQSKSAWDIYFDDIQTSFTENLTVMGDSYGQALGGFASMFEAFANTQAEQQGVIFETARAFRAAEIVASTWTSAQKAYEYGMTFGPWTAGIMMASAIATGVGNLTNLYAAQPGNASINGGASAAPTPNFQQRNPQGGEGGGNRTIVIRYEGLIYGDKDKIARDLYDAFAKAGRDGMGR